MIQTLTINTEGLVMQFEANRRAILAQTTWADVGVVYGIALGMLDLSVKLGAISQAQAITHGDEAAAALCQVSAALDGRVVPVQTHPAPATMLH